MNHRVCLLLPWHVSPTVYSSHVILFPEISVLSFLTEILLFVHIHTYMCMCCFFIQIIAYSFLSLKNIADSFLSLHAYIIFSGYIVFYCLNISYFIKPEGCWWMLKLFWSFAFINSALVNILPQFATSASRNFSIHF